MDDSINTDIPQTTNSGWGFYGTIFTDGGNAHEAWPVAFTSIKKATGCSNAEVLSFLDSRSGRHFADEVSDFMVDDTIGLTEAVEHATIKWMNWTISKDISQEYGIPADTPYLTGFVVSAGIDAETEAKIAPTHGLTVRCTKNSKPECDISKDKAWTVETFSGSGKTTGIRKALAQWVAGKV